MSSTYFFSDCGRELNLLAPDFFFLFFFFAKLKSHSSPPADACNPSTHATARLEIPRRLFGPRVTSVRLFSCLREEEKASGEQVYCLLTSHSESTKKNEL